MPFKEGYNNKTFMRADKNLLKDLNKLKVARGESYCDVVKRMIEKERRRIK